MRLTLPTLAAVLLALAPGLASAQAIAPGASVDCDPVGVGNYRSAIVKEGPAGSPPSVKVDLDDYTPNGVLQTCPVSKLRVVPREAFTKGPPGAFGIFHAGDKVECGAGDAAVPGKIVMLVDPRGTYLVLVDSNDPADKPITCDTGQLRLFSGLPVGGRGFKR